MELCEWNPKHNCPAYTLEILEGDRRIKRSFGCENPATVSVGVKSNIHLCDECAKLPEFKRLRKRVPLK